MRLYGTIFATLVLFGLIAVPLLAHHSAARTFDETKAMTIQGVLTKVEWMNPHVWITLESKDGNGAITGWHVEARAPNAMFRDGIRREDFELAKPCSLEIWPARDGSKTAAGRKLTFVNGKTLDVRDTFGVLQGPVIK